LDDSQAMAVLVLDSRSTAEILLAGDLDADASLEPVVSGILVDPQVQRIVIDAAMTTFCNSSGLTALILAQRQAARQGVALHVARPGASLRRILDATGLAEILLTSV
jgi:anti-sigma B factor antagonist